MYEGKGFQALPPFFLMTVKGVKVMVQFLTKLNLYAVFYILLMFVVSVSCCMCGREEYSIIESYPDLIEIKNIPRSPDDLTCRCFCDLGSWYGYALPPDTGSGVNYLGSFVGPYSVLSQRWVSPWLLRLKFFFNGEERSMQHARREIHYYPGYLLQRFEFNDGINIEEKLFFASSHQAVLLVDVVNGSRRDVAFSLELTQGGLFDGFSFDTSFAIPVLKAENGQFYFSTNIHLLGIDSISKSAEKVVISSDRVCIKKGRKLRFYVVQVYITDREGKDYMDVSGNKSVSELFHATVDRWNVYLKSVLRNCERSKREIAVKALLTLVNNWRSPEGAILHNGIIPSYHTGYFDGFWAWDSWKHAVALSLFDIELAKDQVRAMFDYQDSSGMVADCIFADSSRNNWRNTKPPLAAWAVWEIYKRDGDKSFIKEMIPKLLKYHYWWYRYRDYDRDLLCEYGCCDGSKVAAVWESGMDNAVRFDSCRVVKTSDVSWSLDQESVDLNSYLYFEKIILADMLNEVGFKKEADKLAKEAAVLKNLINTKMYDPSEGYYFDIDSGTDEMCKVFGPEGWIPLFTMVAKREFAFRVREHLVDCKKFNTHVPFPTVEVCNANFDPDNYWRGPVWVDQLFFGIKGLRNYGFFDDAQILREKFFRNAKGVSDKGEPFRENYNPLTGEGLYAEDFSWTAAMVLLMCQRDF